MYGKFKDHLEKQLKEIRNGGFYKEERVITTPQGIEIETIKGLKVLNFCSNNYLGFSSHPRVIEAAKRALDTHGFGMSSVRFICGTQDIHKELENKLSEFLGTEDTILYSSAFDANGGVFEPLLGSDSAIISDELNHASIIDGVRLCKANRYRFRNNNMADLEEQLKQADCDQAKFKLIVTDGVFSMDGITAQVDKICDLAEKYDALVMVDDSHATGFVGKTGRGSHEYCNAMGRVDIITTTFGKALGGASGGCISGKKEIIDMFRQRSRPYLFSNSLSPAIAGATLEVLNMLSETSDLRDKLEKNTTYWRKGLTDAGFILKEGDSPIVPVMLFNAQLSQDISKDLYDEGIYAIGFFFPVVPKGQARIRTQISAGHEIHHLDKALDAFIKTGKKYGILGLTKQEIIQKYGL
ncbi:MAG: glycine C-acetyltransferase [Bacteroidetes bacterium]|nr:glycine C-acetyltransferase [Bacteroidota bacterium]